MKSKVCLQTCHAHAGDNYTTLAGTHLAVVLGSDSDSSSQPGGGRKLAQVLTVPSGDKFGLGNHLQYLLQLRMLQYLEVSRVLMQFAVAPHAAVHGLDLAAGGSAG